MLDDFTANNSESLQILLREFDTGERLPEDVLMHSGESIEGPLVESDPMAAKIAASYFEFAEKVRTYHEIGTGVPQCPGSLTASVTLTAGSAERVYCLSRHK